MQLRSMVEKDKESNRGEAATHDGEGPDSRETITPTATDHTQEWSDGPDDLDRAVRVSSRKVRKVLVHTRPQEHSVEKHGRTQTTTP